MDMRDIARIAGVSSATVSRVINGSNLVKPATTERVRRVIEEVKFFPNSSATTLKYGKSNTYGLMIPDITNPFFPDFMRWFEKILAKNNQEMLMATTDFDPANMQQLVRRMLVRKVDGVALLASEIETEPIEALIHNSVSLVTMDRRVIGTGLSDVAIDNISGMNQALEHLKQFRHRRIGYIGGSAGLTISDHRVEAFIKAIKRVGLRVYPEYICVGNYRISGGEAGMAQLLSLRNRPTAVLTANDLTAIGAMRVIRQHGLSVPDDVSVIGFDDIDLCDIVSPSLTTLRLSRPALAETFFDALEFAKKNPALPGRQYRVKTTLIVRESTGFCKSKRAAPVD